MNVLLIIGDHHRHDAHGFMGNPLAHTPNLDRLAARSVRFTNCYSQAPVCAPARYSIATGRYCHAHGVLNNHAPPKPGYRTVAHALEPLGFRRLQSGHMHWTDAEAEETGFEPIVGTQKAWHEGLSAEARRRYDWECQGITRRTTGGPGPLRADQHWDQRIVDDALHQIEEAAGAGEPFLSFVAIEAPHPPFYPPVDLYRRIDQSQIPIPDQPPADAPPAHPSVVRKREEWRHLTEVEIRQMIAGYYGMVALADHFAGRVLEAVERLGMAEETLIVWTADHGEQIYEHGLFTKFVMRDASVRVPLFVSHPRFRPGVRPQMVEHVDLLPTICELAGAEVPEGVHGRSLVPLLESEATPDGWRDAVFSQIGDAQMIRTADRELNVYGGVPGELYDLARDPREFHNLVRDPAHAETVAGLHRRLQQWEAAYR